jgi:integrase
MGVTVRQKNGEWWVFVNHKGKRKSKKAGSEKAALAAAEKIQALLVLDEYKMEDKNAGLTFKQYAEMWLSIPSDRKEGTTADYRGTLKRYVYSVLGKKPIDEIKRKDLKALFDSLLVKGLHPSTVATIRAPIKNILAHAVDSEIIETNPLNDLKVKRAKKTDDILPLTEEEVTLLLEKTKTYLNGYYYPHLPCALRTGMRIGELEALQWGDIDFNGRFIEVQRGNRRGRVTDTKNRKRRRVDMTPHLVETMKALRKVQVKAALKRGGQVAEWVFANPKGEKLNRALFTRVLQSCLTSAGLRRIRVHDLRHTYATIRLMRGHNVGDVSYQLGHSSIKITYDTYCHWIPGRFKGQVDDLDMAQLTAPQAHPEESVQGNFKGIQSVTKRVA